jgi:apolipoprotein D and lipocalin family protein
MPTGPLATAGLSTAIGKLAGVATALAALAVSLATATPPVHGVDKLDMSRYAGTWFEVARLPNKLQARCRFDVTATYRLKADGTVTVLNRCVDANEHVKVDVGHATPLDGDPAKLRLSYVPDWLSWWPGTRSDHWVVMLDDDYRYAVVSDSTRSALWILSRSPALDAATYDGIVSRLRAQRYPVDQLVLTPQRVLEELRPDAGRPSLMV